MREMFSLARGHASHATNMFTACRRPQKVTSYSCLIKYVPAPYLPTTVSNQTDSTRQSPLERNSLSGIQEILKFYSRVRNSPPLVPVLNQNNAVHNLPPRFYLFNGSNHRNVITIRKVLESRKSKLVYC